ncbi:MAG: hypothetical protein EP343_06720 [Deltaproteobacteria bacterium]|nr:MAG: hypothetical protein EP343_06720 [Deltaproteobacteria bacterium]
MPRLLRYVFSFAMLSGVIGVGCLAPPDVCNLQCERDSDCLSGRCGSNGFCTGETCTPATFQPRKPGTSQNNDGGVSNDTNTTDSSSIRQVVISSIEGDGSESPPTVPVNVAGQLPGARRARQRFRTGWVLQGQNLDRIETMKLVRKDDPSVTFTEQDGLQLETTKIEGAIMTRTMKLPKALMTGLYILVGVVGGAEVTLAETYILQGEKGESASTNETLQKLLQHLTVVVKDGKATITFDRANVQITNGTGQTGRINGYGNLIVGYNKQVSNVISRNGSHNLLVGDNHSYNSYAGVAFGESNTLGGPYASVTGGKNNKALGAHSSVQGGELNESTGDLASVSGGTANVAKGRLAAVLGGSKNQANANASSVSGGTANIASGQFSSVVGGSANDAQGNASSITGGSANRAYSPLSVVLAGKDNEAGVQTDSGLNSDAGAKAAHSTVVGGESNKSLVTFATILGGSTNSASGKWSTITGGQTNKVTENGTYGSISGGKENQVQAVEGWVGGGIHNEANGALSSVAGGSRNIVRGNSASIIGGQDNEVKANGRNTTVCGGSSNIATAAKITVLGGTSNQVDATGVTSLGGNAKQLSTANQCTACPQ